MCVCDINIYIYITYTHTHSGAVGKIQRDVSLMTSMIHFICLLTYVAK
jgi:hypothetical protein